MGGARLGRGVNTGVFGINLMCVGKGQWEIEPDESAWFERLGFNGLERLSQQGIYHVSVKTFVR